MYKVLGREITGINVGSGTTHTIDLGWRQNNARKKFRVTRHTGP